MFNLLGKDYFQTYSAGSHPAGKVNPFALEQIKSLAINFIPKSKSWNEITGVHIDFVITVCGNAAQEICPCFGGNPKHIHWGEPDPAAVTGSDDDKRQEFSACFKLFELRVKQLINDLDEYSSAVDNSVIMQLLLKLQ